LEQTNLAKENGERDSSCAPEVSLDGTRKTATEAEATVALTQIRLVNFRSYVQSEIVVAPSPVALIGENGVGKTNLLEAISLLAPGRGLRGAKLAEVQRRAPQEPLSDAPFDGALWAVSATLTREDGNWALGTGLAASANGGERRLMRLNGADAAGAEIAELLPVLWLTPAMDRLFLEGASGRRRFLDRLVFGLDVGHARRSVHYETAMRERARVLAMGRTDPSWLDGLEYTMAETGSAITQARCEAIDALNGELAKRESEGDFPSAQLSLENAPDIATVSDAAVLRERLYAMRGRDAEAGRTLVGPHIADLVVRHTEKRADARQCSTGEQKALLISIVLANAWLQKHRRGHAPLLLLDEIAAHLDAGRRASLIAEILALRAQAWMTGTDRALFAGENSASSIQIYAVTNGRFVPQE
jgi:DNA replication and repair protein RecF